MSFVMRIVGTHIYHINQKGYVVKLYRDFGVHSSNNRILRVLRSNLPFIIWITVIQNF